MLASSTANPASQPEEIVEFVTSRGGAHYLRITGTGTDDAQLYRLEVEVAAPEVADAAPTAPRADGPSTAASAGSSAQPPSAPTPTRAGPRRVKPVRRRHKAKPKEPDLGY